MFEGDALFWWLLYGGAACCIFGVLFGIISMFIPSWRGPSSFYRRDNSKEIEIMLRRQTEIMERNRMEAMSSTDYFKSGFDKKKE